MQPSAWTFGSSSSPPASTLGFSSIHTTPSSPTSGRSPGQRDLRAPLIQGGPTVEETSSFGNFVQSLFRVESPVGARGSSEETPAPVTGNQGPTAGGRAARETEKKKGLAIWGISILAPPPPPAEIG